MKRRTFIALLAGIPSVVVAMERGQKAPAKKGAKAVRQPAYIDQAKCTHCGKCYENCPVKAIQWKSEKGVDIYTVNAHQCISCGTCIKNCPVKAINWAATPSERNDAQNDVQKKHL